MTPTVNYPTSDNLLSIFLKVFAVTIALVFASMLVYTAMPYLTQDIETITTVINEFAVWSLKQIQTINNVPSVLAIAAIAHIIIRNQYRKQLATIQRRVEIMDRYIDENIQHNDDSQEVIEQANEAAPAPVVERIEVQDVANLSETSVENWTDYSIEDKIQICEAMKQGCRFGKTDLGKMEIDLATGQIIKTII